MKLSREMVRSVILYLALLLACFVASFFPESRLWGLNEWGFLPVWARYTLVTVGLLILLPACCIRDDSSRFSSSSVYWKSTVIVFLGLGASFYLFRFQTFFLGDGYTLISLLAAETPLVKWRNYGGTILQKVILPLFSGTPTEAAVGAYQAVSWLAGFCFMIAAAVGSRFLSRRPFDRAILFLGLCTGGYALLFFGYAENYALFVVAVNVYCLLGLGIVQERVGKWWIILPQIAAVFFHVFGLILLPATGFLLARQTPAVQRLIRRFRTRPALTAALVLGTGFLAFALLRANSIAMQVMLLPIVSDSLTIDNYTLFSLNHLLDIGNLCFLLCPGALIALMCRWFDRSRSASQSAEAGFLGLVAVLCFATVFLIDPKLGAARDWDLFAFSGVPLVLLCFRSVLNGSTEAGNRVAAILMVGLAVVVLAGRVAVGVLPEAGIQQTRAYLYLDPVRNHNCWSILVDYYTANGDSTLAIGTHAEKFAFLPEESTLVVSRRLLERGETEQGLTALLRVKGRYGGVGAYHSQLGTALLKLGRTSEAFDELRIAQEMNPYDPIVRTNLGSIHFLRGDTARAENYWRRALSIDPTSIMSLYGLAVAARARGETEALMEIFDQGESLPHMQADFYRLMAEVTSSRGDYERAARAIRIGLERGLDSAFVKAIRARHPALGSP